jgi:hypothetical protein
MNKSQCILKDIAHQHLPEYQQGNQLPTLITNWRHYSVEHIVEDAMAHVGGFRYVDQDHYDNSDYSETKTGTCRRHDRTATISGILSRHTKTAKAGDIRAVVYNEFTQQLDYFFLPKADWEQMREYGEANCSILRTKYQPATDVYTKWERFRVKDFETLAKTAATITSPHEYTVLDTPRNVLFDWNPRAGLFDAV